MEGEHEYKIQLKDVKAKSASSGQFFSIRSFFMGFWNNLLGMFGFVKMRGAARKNWEERKVYEAKIAKRTLEIKLKRIADWKNNNKNNNQKKMPNNVRLLWVDPVPQKNNKTSDWMEASIVS